MILWKNISFKNDTKLAATDSLGIRIPYKYKRKFTLDYYGAQYQYDLIQNEGQGVGYFLFSDILGNHKIELQTSLVIDFKHSDIMLNYLNLENKIGMWCFC